MTWLRAEYLLTMSIVIGQQPDPFKKYKIVVDIPGNGNNQSYYRIQVGAKSFINVYKTMLERLFDQIELNNGIYDCDVFKALYRGLASMKPCYVHAVGKLFVAAGVMTQIDYYTYQLL